MKLETPRQKFGYFNISKKIRQKIQHVVDSIRKVKIDQMTRLELFRYLQLQFRLISHHIRRLSYHIFDGLSLEAARDLTVRCTRIISMHLY